MNAPHIRSSSVLETLLAARVFDLAQPLEPTLPVRRGDIPYRIATVYRHGDFELPFGVSGALEMINMSTHTGTHIDAISHISCDGKLYGGIDAAEAQRGGLLKQMGVETITPLVYRGVLLDIAATRGVERLPPGAAVTGHDMEGARRKQDVEIQPGAAVLIRTGWGDREHYRTEKYFDTPPGTDTSGAEWLVDRGVKLTGSDTIIYEQANPKAPGTPVHKMLIVDAGVYIVENLFLEQLAQEKVYEFALVISPLPMAGASGAPMRPLALEV